MKRFMLSVMCFFGFALCVYAHTQAEAGIMANQAAKSSNTAATTFNNTVNRYNTDSNTYNTYWQYTYEGPYIKSYLEDAYYRLNLTNSNYNTGASYYNTGVDQYNKQQWDAAYASFSTAKSYFDQETADCGVINNNDLTSAEALMGE